MGTTNKGSISSNDDITQTGAAVRGVRNSDLYPNNDPALKQSIQRTVQERRSKPLAERMWETTPEPQIEMGFDLAKTDFGNSRFDKNIQSLEQLNDLNELRALSQSGAGKLLTFLPKTLSTFVSSYALGFPELIVGTGKLITDVVTGQDKGKSIGEIYASVWDNPFSQAMASVDKWMDQALPSYQTREEQQAGTFSKEILGSATFWGNQLRNAGFIVGSMYSGNLVSAAMRAFKLTNGIAKMILAVNGLNEASKGVDVAKAALKGFNNTAEYIHALKNAVKVSKRIQTGIGALISSQGEATVEAINNSNQWAEETANTLNDLHAKNVEFIKNDTTSSEEEKQARLDAENKSYAESFSKIDADRKKMGSLDYALNILVLMLSNIIQFGKMYSGGYNAARHAAKEAVEKGVSKAEQKILADNAKNAFIDSMDNGLNIVRNGKQYLSQMTKTKGILRAGLNALSEGQEELLQQGASDVAGAVQRNKLLDYYSARRDPKTSKDTIKTLNTFWNNIIPSMKDTVDNPDTWMQFISGAAMGALGMPVFGKSNTKNNAYLGKGKFIGMAGGVFGEYKEYKETMARSQAIAKNLTDAINDPTFVSYIQGLNRFTYFDEKAREAAKNDYHKLYQDAEDKRLVSVVNMFYDAGRVQDLADIVNEGFDLSDENIKSIRDETTSKMKNGISEGPFVHNGNYIGDDKVKESLTKRKQEILDTINDYTKARTIIDLNADRDFTPEKKDELTFLKMAHDRALKRVSEIAPNLVNSEDSASLKDLLENANRVKDSYKEDLAKDDNETDANKKLTTEQRAKLEKEAKNAESAASIFDQLINCSDDTRGIAISNLINGLALKDAKYKAYIKQRDEKKAKEESDNNKNKEKAKDVAEGQQKSKEELEKIQKEQDEKDYEGTHNLESLLSMFEDFAGQASNNERRAELSSRNVLASDTDKFEKLLDNISDISELVYDSQQFIRAYNDYMKNPEKLDKDMKDEDKARSDRAEQEDVDTTINDNIINNEDVSTGEDIYKKLFTLSRKYTSASSVDNLINNYAKNEADVDGPRHKAINEFKNIYDRRKKFIRAFNRQYSSQLNDVQTNQIRTVISKIAELHPHSFDDFDFLSDLDIDSVMESLRKDVEGFSESSDSHNGKFRSNNTNDVTAANNIIKLLKEYDSNKNETVQKIKSYLMNSLNSKEVEINQDDNGKVKPDEATGKSSVRTKISKDEKTKSIKTKIQKKNFKKKLANDIKELKKKQQGAPKEKQSKKNTPPTDEVKEGLFAPENNPNNPPETTSTTETKVENSVESKEENNKESNEGNIEEQTVETTAVNLKQRLLDLVNSIDKDRAASADLTEDYNKYKSLEDDIINSKDLTDEERAQLLEDVKGYKDLYIQTALDMRELDRENEGSATNYGNTSTQDGNGISIDNSTSRPTKFFDGLRSGTRSNNEMVTAIPYIIINKDGSITFSTNNDSDYKFVANIIAGGYSNMKGFSDLKFEDGTKVNLDKNGFTKMASIGPNTKLSIVISKRLDAQEDTQNGKHTMYLYLDGYGMINILRTNPQSKALIEKIQKEYEEFLKNNKDNNTVFKSKIQIRTKTIIPGSIIFSNKSYRINDHIWFDENGTQVDKGNYVDGYGHEVMFAIHDGTNFKVLNKNGQNIKTEEILPTKSLGDSVKGIYMLIPTPSTIIDDKGHPIKYYYVRLRASKLSKDNITPELKGIIKEMASAKTSLQFQIAKSKLAKVLYIPKSIHINMYNADFIARTETEINDPMLDLPFNRIRVEKAITGKRRDTKHSADYENKVGVKLSEDEIEKSITDALISGELAYQIPLYESDSTPISSEKVIGFARQGLVEANIATNADIGNKEMPNNFPMMLSNNWLSFYTEEESAQMDKEETSKVKQEPEVVKEQNISGEAAEAVSTDTYTDESNPFNMYESTGKRPDGSSKFYRVTVNKDKSVSKTLIKRGSKEDIKATGIEVLKNSPISQNKEYVEFNYIYKDGTSKTYYINSKTLEYSSENPEETTQEESEVDTTSIAKKQDQDMGSLFDEINTINPEEKINGGDGKSLSRVVDKTIKYQKWNKEKELAWLSKIFPKMEPEELYKVHEGLSNLNNAGVESWGIFDGSLIHLSNVAASGTVYHEAFHAVFHGLLNKEERQKVFEEARKKYKGNNIIVEDALAEDFRRFMEYRESKFTGFILHMYDRLMLFLKNHNIIHDNIKSLFRGINEAQFSNREFVKGSLNIDNEARAEMNDTKVYLRNFHDINSTMKKALEEDGWDETTWNNASTEERENALNCKFI
jgi:hypothetical protein